MDLLTRRRLLQGLLAISAAIGTSSALAACGQTRPTPQRTGAAVPFGATPATQPASETPGGIPTKPGGIPTPPPIAPTLIIPTLAYEPTPPTKPIYPTRPPATIDPNMPCSRIVSVSGRPSVSMSAHAATLIVEGTVQQVMPARWDTVDGRRPVTCPNPQNSIFTPVVLTIEQFLKGTSERGQVLLYAYGGEIGQDKMWVGIPPDQRYIFHEGERAVVLLVDPIKNIELKAIDGAPLYYLLDHFTVLPDGQATDGTRTIPYQQLLDEIAAGQQ
jgi:hypothetical protein